MSHSRNLFVIDFHGLTDIEIRQQFPLAYQHLYEKVKPERDLNREEYRSIELVALWAAKYYAT